MNATAPASADVGDLFDLHGRTAVVTGSGRGLGKAIARGLAAAGADLVICSRTASEAQATAAELQADGLSAEATTVDTADRDSCGALVEFAVDRFGRLDVLVNNAGIDIIKPAEEISAEEYQKVIDINLTGYFNCAQLAGRHMIDNGGGSIINNSSIASESGIHGLVAYSAAKGGVNMLTRVMAAEWATRGVRVNAIGPGYFDNIMRDAGDEHASPEKQEQIRTFTPMQRRGRPEELVGPVLFLASPASSYVTGNILFVDGGYNAI